MAVLSGRLSLFLHFAVLISIARAARTVRRHEGAEVELEGAVAGARTECNDMYATVRFPSIEIQFSILKKGARGELHKVQCGPTAANPDEEVTFNCTDFDGELAWSYASGNCRSEEVAPGSSVTCPPVEFEATWTVGELSVPMVFAMKETANPDGEDMPVKVECPEDTPGVGKTLTFTCTKSGQWDFNGGKETIICASEGDDLIQQESSPEKPAEVHEVVAGALPCALDSEDKVLKGGDKGFTLIIKCEKPITDGIIKVDGVDSWTFKGKDFSHPSNLVTLSDEYFGKELTVQAHSEEVLGSVSIRPKPQAELASLPCELSTRSVLLQGSKKGFQVLINCESPITKGVLILPGYNSKTLGDPLSGWKTLYTQSVAEFKGKTLLVTGFSNGIKGKTNGVTI